MGIYVLQFMAQESSCFQSSLVIFNLKHWKFGWKALILYRFLYAKVGLGFLISCDLKKKIFTSRMTCVKTI